MRRGVREGNLNPSDVKRGQENLKRTMFSKKTDIQRRVPRSEGTIWDDTLTKMGRGQIGGEKGAHKLGSCVSLGGGANYSIQIYKEKNGG